MGLVVIKPWQERSTRASLTEDCDAVSACRLDKPRLLSGLALVHPVVGVGGGSAQGEVEKRLAGDCLGRDVGQERAPPPMNAGVDGGAEVRGGEHEGPEIRDGWPWVGDRGCRGHRDRRGETRLGDWTLCAGDGDWVSDGVPTGGE